MKKISQLFGLCILFALTTAGCLGGIGEKCEIDSDCRTGLVCYIPWEYFGTDEGKEGTCRRPCVETEDCGGNLICDAGACVPPREEEEDADTDAADVGAEEPPVDLLDDDGIDITEDDGPDAVEIPSDCPVRDIEMVDGQCQWPSEFPYMFKMTLFNVGMDGHPGSGLDLDGNASTCAPGQDLPTPVCSGGIDNGIAMLGVMGNLSLDAAIEDGSMNIICELTGYDDSGCTFSVDYYVGVLQSGSPGCVQQPGCVYAISDESFDPETCAPSSSIGDALVQDGSLTGGGDEFVYIFDAIVVGMRVIIPVLRPRLEAQVQFSGAQPVSIDGIIGGVIRKDDFIAAFEAIPEEDFPNPPSKDELIQMWEDMYTAGDIERDFDLDGDTVPDASSVGILFSGLPVSISGVTHVD